MNLLQLSEQGSCLLEHLLLNMSNKFMSTGHRFSLCRTTQFSKLGKYRLCGPPSFLDLLCKIVYYRFQNLQYYFLLLYFVLHFTMSARTAFGPLTA